MSHLEDSLEEDPATVATERSDVSSNVTSLSAASTLRWEGVGPRGQQQVVQTASQLIADLQVLLRDDAEVTVRDEAASSGDLARRKKRPSLSKSSSTTIESSRAAPQPPEEQPLAATSGQQPPVPPSAGKPPQLPQQRPEPAAHPLDLQACNGTCVVFANFASFLPDGSGTLGGGVDSESVGGPGQRASQIRDSVAAVGRLFNSQLEFVVLIHWNKTRVETLQLLRQAAAAMSEGGRDCCFAFFLGRGGPDHFLAACGGRVALTDVLATLAVGQRARLPVFVLGEVTGDAPAVDAAAAAAGGGVRPRLNPPSNQVLLWTLGAPQVTDMLVDQLARAHLAGGPDVASTLAAIAEWIRRRGRGSGCGCRFLGSLGRLVYLASPDCI